MTEVCDVKRWEVKAAGGKMAFSFFGQGILDGREARF